MKNTIYLLFLFFSIIDAMELATFDMMREALINDQQKKFQQLYEKSSLHEKQKIDQKNNTILHLVLKYGNDDSIARVENEFNYFNINGIDAYNNTALHIAIKKRNDKDTEALIEKLIPLTDCTLQNKSKITVLDSAYSYGHEAIVQKILDAKGNVPELVNKFNDLNLLNEKYEPEVYEDKEKKRLKQKLALLIRCRLSLNTHPVNNQKS